MPETSCGPTVGALLLAARQRLREAGIAGADFDARLLVGETLALDAAGLILKADIPVEATATALAESRIARRIAGEPVHRILGHRPFHRHDFRLSSETLEPRPDTEILVDLAERVFRQRFGASGAFRFADLGTGSGAIAVSLLDLFPGALALGVDISHGAAKMARVNAATCGVYFRFLPLVGDYLSALGARLDAIISNPPYIPRGEIGALEREVRDFDPILALDGGEDGLDAYRSIAACASRHLTETGDVLLEIGAGQQDDVAEIFAGQGFFLAGKEADFGGHIRALWFKRDKVEKIA